MLAYYDNYLIDTTSRVILGVDATPARFRQEMLAARRMIEQVETVGIRPRIWQRTRLTEVESFWPGCWSVACNRTFRLLTVVIRREDASPATSFATSLRKMPTTVQRENRCSIGVRGAVVRAISIAPRKRNAKAVRKRNDVPQALSEIVCSLAGASAASSSRLGRYRLL